MGKQQHGGGGLLSSEGWPCGSAVVLWSPCVAAAALHMAACAGWTLLAAHGRWRSSVESQSLGSGSFRHSLMYLIGSGGRTGQNNLEEACICQRCFLHPAWPSSKEAKEGHVYRFRSYGNVSTWS